MVTVKGSKTPMGLYTVDLDISKLKTERETNIRKSRRKIIHNKQKKKNRKLAINGMFNTEALFKEDKDLAIITANARGEYRDRWELALKDYKDGNWSQAKTKFENFMEERPDIGTSAVVYNYMKARGFQAPDDWAGFRALTSK